MSVNQTNLIMAIRGYKSIKKQQNQNFTDITAVDDSNNKVLLRTIDPLRIEYTGINDINDMTNVMKNDNYTSAILISKHFTNKALDEMKNQNIQYISEDFALQFGIEELYRAIQANANNKCQQKCGKTLTDINECNETTSDSCTTKKVLINAKNHFESGFTGLLKNDLKSALSTR